MWILWLWRLLNYTIFILVLNFSSVCLLIFQLRYLQTLTGISAEKNSTIIFPLPIDVMSHFFTKWKGAPQIDGHKMIDCNHLRTQLDTLRHANTTKSMDISFATHKKVFFADKWNQKLYSRQERDLRSRKKCWRHFLMLYFIILTVPWWCQEF